MNIISLSLLDKTVQVTPQVMRMLGGLLEREVTRDGPEWAAALASLTVSEKAKIMPSRRQHKENERDCRTIVQQLVSSIPHEVLTSTSYGRKEQGNDTQKKTVTFVDQDKEGEKVERNLVQDCLSGETNGEKNRRVQDQHQGQGSLSGESDVDEKVPDEKQDLENKVLSGEFRWMRRRHRTDLEEGTCSIADSSMDDNSRNSGIDTYSDRMYRPQSSSEPGQRTDVQDRLGEAPLRRTINPRRRLGPINPTAETTSSSRSDTRSETTSTSREERRPNRSSLMWSRPIPSPWHIYKDDLMKLNLQTVSFAADAMRMLIGARLSVNGLYSITGVDWLTAAGINFSSTTDLSFADLEGLPSNNTMGPVNARPLQDVNLNHDEGHREERPGRFLTTRAPIEQHVKMFRQVKAPPGNVKERAYPKQVNQEGDVQRYGGLKAIKKYETIFAAYDKAEMRKAKIMIVASSEFVYTSQSLFWSDVLMLAAVDLDLTQSVSMEIGVQRQTDMNPITIVFAGINDHLHSRGFLSRLREPTTAEAAVWPAIKDILESMGEVEDTLKEGAFTKITPRAVFALSTGYAHLPDGLKFVYAIVALLSEGKYDVIISAPNREIKMENLRPLRAELPAVWSDISNEEV